MGQQATILRCIVGMLCIGLGHRTGWWCRWGHACHWKNLTTKTKNLGGCCIPSLLGTDHMARIHDSIVWEWIDR
jgi:hypothetical protein